MNFESIQIQSKTGFRQVQAPWQPLCEGCPGASLKVTLKVNCSDIISMLKCYVAPLTFMKEKHSFVQRSDNDR